jgi:hypothetical protein
VFAVYTGSPEYSATRSWVPKGNAEVTHVATSLEITTGLVQPVTTEYVTPFVEYSNVTFPPVGTPEGDIAVTVAVMSTVLLTATGDAGVTVSVVVSVPPPGFTMKEIALLEAS